MIFFRVLLTSLLLTSTCPFAWELYDLVTRWCTSYFFKNARKCELLKCEPPLPMMALGKPYQAKMHLVMNLSTSRWSFVLVGIASTHLNTQSTATKIYSFPSDGGKCPINLSLINQRSPLQESVASAFHLAWRFSMLLDIVDTPCRNGGRP